MDSLSARLLGRPDLGTSAARRALEPGQVSQLLVYLAYRGDWVRRDELIELFWPDGGDRTGRRNLRRLLYRARQRLDAFGDAVPGIEAEADRLRWSVATDVAAWRDALAREDIDAAFVQWRGPLGDGIDPRGDAGFTRWLAEERAALHSVWKDALFSLADRVVAERPDDAAAMLRKLVALDPLDEEAVQAHLRVLARAGRPTEMERVFRAFEARLADELGLEPERNTSAILQAVRSAAKVDEHADQHAPLGQLHAARVERPAVSTPLILPFGGRASYLRELDDHLRRARAGAGGALVIEGEAGVGKTRLAEEFLSRAAARGVRVYHGRCFESELGAPLEPVRTALAELMVGADVGPYELAKVWSSERPGLADVHHGLTARLVQAARNSGGVVLFIDDIQWADPATLDFLAYAAKRVKVEPVMLILGQRREDRAALQDWRADLQSQRALGTLDVGRLQERELDLLLQQIASLPEHDLRWLASFVHRQTEGNPFFATEYLRWLERAGSIRAAAGRIVALDRGRIEAGDLPENVLALIWTRYLAFDHATRELLDLAAVTGRAFDLEMLEDASGKPPEPFWEAFAPLVTAGTMVAAGDGAYAFSHDKLRQTIYHRLGPPVRRVLHRRVAEALERTGAEPPELAHHRLRSHDWPAAFDHLMSTGRRAERESVWQTALQAYRRAEEVAVHLPRTARRRFEALEGVERLLELMDRRKERATVVRDMLALAEELDDPELEGHAQLKWMAVRALSGDREGARAARGRAVELLRRAGDAAGEARIYRELAYTAFTLGDDREMIDAGLGAIRVYRAVGDRRNEAATAWSVALAYRRMNRVKDALEWADRAADIYEAIGSEVGGYMRHEMRAWALRRSGATREACALLEKTLELARALRERHLILEKHMNLAICLLEVGEPEQAARNFEEAAKLGAELGDPRHEGYALLQAAAARQNAGDAEGAIRGYRDAARLLGSAYSLNGVPEEHLAEADAWILLGSALAECDAAAADEATTAFGNAVAIASEHRDDARLSKALMERGVLHWRADRHREAATDFSDAAAAADQAGLVSRAIAALASRTVSLLRHGDAEEAIRTGDRALERLCAFPDRLAESWLLRSLAQAHGAAGNPVLARACRMRSARLRRAADASPPAAEAYRDLGRHRGRGDSEVQDA